ncbi:MAG: cation-translocating P-type ATPase [Pseudomonadota bacterium]
MKHWPPASAAHTPEAKAASQQQAPACHWHALTSRDALAHLESAPSGLTGHEAERRLAFHGPNRITREQTRPWWRRLLSQFNNILILVLIAAGLASLGMAHYPDAAAIFAVVLVIALIGFFQEGKAEQAIESIRTMLVLKASVIRDGHRALIEAEALVPGDLVMVESGDRIPADLRLLEATRLSANEAALTGESVPVDKQNEPVPEDAALADRYSMAFAGTFVVQGTATGVVVATGRQSQIGRISELLRSVDKLRTPLLVQMDQAGRVLALVILAASIFMALVGILVHQHPVSDMFMAAVGLAVAAIPEGLPAIVTIALALGVQAMARHNAIIRHLPAVETLGEISTIFSDKTGTLTRNEMTVQAIWLPDRQYDVTGTGFMPEGDFMASGASAPLDPTGDPELIHFLRAGILCNDAELARDDGQWLIHGDPTEGALVVAAMKAGLDPPSLRHNHTRHATIPFESERRYMATLHNVGGDGRLFVKGAPDRLLEMCSGVRGVDGEQLLDIGEWRERIRTLSARGLRVLAFAEKATPDPANHQLEDGHVESGLILLGLVGMYDPPREDVFEAVAQCRSAGIRPVMVTGDHAGTALAIARQLGFVHTSEALTGHDIECMSDAGLRECIEKVDVFARATPEHKLRLVKALQARGGVCAMTGDGVNDAPALKRADVGVAMGMQGTGVARDAAEMVLADDNFATIVTAIREGRKVYDNIRKTITFLLPTNGGQGLAIMLAVLAGVTLPVTPLQALWVNMVVAVTLGLALAFEPPEADIMQRQPRDPSAPMLDGFLLWRVVFVSLLLVSGVFGLFTWVLEYQGGSEALARSAAVNMLVMGSAAYLINSRFLTGSALSFQGLFGSAPVWFTIGLVLLFQMAWTYTPLLQTIFDSAALPLTYWGIILGASVILFLIVELEKQVLRCVGHDRPQPE